MLRIPRTLALVLSLAWCGAVSAHVAAPSITAAPQTAQTHRDQDARALADYVTRFLQTRSGNGDALHIQVERPRTKGLASCAKLHAVRPKRLRSRTSIQVRCLAPQTWSLYVQVNLALPGVHYTAARTVAPGDVVASDDLHAAHADLLRLPQDAIIDPAQAIGRIATQRMRKGDAIKSGALRSPASIQRGQRVHIETRGPGFVMRGAGQALQSGAPGSQIQVRAASGSVVSGIVLNAATVQVPL